MILNQLVVPDLEMYNNVKDEQLIEFLRAGDTAAEEELILRYASYVRSFVRPYFLAGGDSEDLIQEGMIGVFKAILEFDCAHHTLFKTFAVSCIRNRVYSAIRHSMRGKNAPLNNYVSIETPVEPSLDGDGASVFADSAPDPVEQIIGEESYKELLSAVSKLLSSFEEKVLELYLLGMSYSEISEKTSKPQKSVDNAVQRIRRKFARYLKQTGDNR